MDTTALGRSAVGAAGVGSAEPARPVSTVADSLDRCEAPHEAAITTRVATITGEPMFIRRRTLPWIVRLAGGANRWSLAPPSDNKLDLVVHGGQYDAQQGRLASLSESQKIAWSLSLGDDDSRGCPGAGARVEHARAGDRRARRTAVFVFQVYPGRESAAGAILALVDVSVQQTCLDLPGSAVRLGFRPFSSNEDRTAGRWRPRTTASRGRASREDKNRRAWSSRRRVGLRNLNTRQAEPCPHLLLPHFSAFWKRFVSC